MLPRNSRRTPKTAVPQYPVSFSAAECSFTNKYIPPENQYITAVFLRYIWSLLVHSVVSSCSVLLSSKKSRNEIQEPPSGRFTIAQSNYDPPIPIGKCWASNVAVGPPVSSLARYIVWWNVKVDRGWLYIYIYIYISYIPLFNIYLWKLMLAREQHILE